MKQRRVSRQNLSRLRLGRQGRGPKRAGANNQDLLSDKSELAFQDELAYPLLTLLVYGSQFSSATSSDDAFNHLCGPLRPHEVQLALSQSAGKGWSLNQTTGIYSLRAPSSRPSCDATAAKLCVIDLISQHDESPDQ